MQVSARNFTSQASRMSFKENDFQTVGQYEEDLTEALEKTTYIGRDRANFSPETAIFPVKSVKILYGVGKEGAPVEGTRAADPSAEFVPDTLNQVLVYSRGNNIGSCGTIFDTKGKIPDGVAVASTPVIPERPDICYDGIVTVLNRAQDPIQYTNVTTGARAKQLGLESTSLIHYNYLLGKPD